MQLIFVIKPPSYYGPATVNIFNGLVSLECGYNLFLCVLRVMYSYVFIVKN